MGENVIMNVNQNDSFIYLDVKTLYNFYIHSHLLDINHS